ncbi:hypothetical protein EG856_02355 [Mycoplasmopsis phocirhinis]|uniref:Integrase catalytic domain-containing protein n=1 Tax=Mycoplasmopsis phocirhinis TaxID=142650 RepID=A0A4P6MML3_9BACT|nr:hypothetical protein [Mycoplasmopsis phocirhinis]QBF34748.1 hypothetical protein EG856_02355 [Mycoplasmopsis phocirhinis]
MDKLTNYVIQKKWCLDTIITFKHETYKQLANRINKSVSTVRLYKNELKRGNGYIENIEHKNTNNKNAQRYNDEMVLNLGQEYENKKLLASGNNANSSCNSYMSLISYHEKLKTYISYSQMVKRLKQNGFCSAFAYKAGRKEARKARIKLKKKGFGIKYSLDLELKIPKKKEVERKRTRLKYSFGDVVEIDGCTHYFVKNELWTAISSIDVATGKLLSIHFEKNVETLNGHQSNLEKMLNRYGIPSTIITDKRKNFYNNEDSNAVTFKAIKNLGIELITTSNSNGKPHIENAQNFIQMRLPLWFLDNKINTIQQANDAEESILKYLNQIRKSVIEPKVNHFRELNKERLEHFFDLEIARKINNGTIFYNGIHYAPYQNDKRIRVESKFDAKFVIEVITNFILELKTRDMKQKNATKWYGTIRKIFNK